MAGKDRQTHPNAEMRPDSECMHTHTCMECWREMGGGGGHLMGAPTNWKDGLWGQWWAKLPQVLEWQGWTGGSKCSMIWPEMEVGACVQAKMLPGVAGEWWWASNECASLPKEGPLGPVLKRGHSRRWVMRGGTVSKCSDGTGFGTCMAVPGCSKIDKRSMERVYGGHIMVHHPWGKWLLGWCVYVGTL